MCCREIFFNYCAGIRHGNAANVLGRGWSQSVFVFIAALLLSSGMLQADITITQLANEGVILSDGETRIMIDPQKLTADLVRCASVTPEEGGALVLLEQVLSQAGFACTRVDRGEVSNLFARWGDKGHARTFGFNGHTDVVPVGDAASWTHPPFGAKVQDGWLYGRGATDMKSGVAAFAAAAIDFVRDTPPDGAIVLTITGDEEGEATDGTVAILDWMAEQGERIRPGDSVGKNQSSSCLNAQRSSSASWRRSSG